MRIDWSAKFRAASSAPAEFGISEEFSHITEGPKGGVTMHGEGMSNDYLSFLLWTVIPITLGVAVSVRNDHQHKQMRADIAKLKERTNWLHENRFAGINRKALSFRA